MKNFIRKFIGDGPDKMLRGMLVGIILSVTFWTLLFLIQLSIGVFMPRMMVGVVAALSGVTIGTWVSRLTD